MQEIDKERDKAIKSESNPLSDELYWEWLCSIPGIYRGHQELLLRCFQTPEGVWKATPEELDYLRGKGYPWITKVQAFREQSNPEKLMHDRMHTGIQFISHEHVCYPEKLKTLKDKPYGLFWKGTLPDPRTRAVAIVGARMCTRDGKEMAVRIAQVTAQAGGCVVSGGAYGIDGSAQWAAMEAGGPTYAVMGCGVDQCYPSPHRALFDQMIRQGAMISEFPPGTPPLRQHFPLRNRIISGLADVVVVVEARKRSGSLITAEFAVEQNREVFAVPGRPWDELSEGCNELIAQGAGVILSPKAFAEEIFPDFSLSKKKGMGKIALAPAEKLVYSSLGLHAKSVWELEAETALTPAELGNVLWTLEQKELVKETDRNYYVKMK